MTSQNEFQHQSRRIELFDPKKYYPVLEVLSLYLTIADMLVLCRVCKELDGLKDCMLKISNVNIQLKDFVDDPPMFRSKMGKYGALISGSFALNLLELGQRKVFHLDIFIKDVANADHFTNYMRENEKYQSDNPEVETVQNAKACHLGSSAGPGIKLRIARTSGSPINAILTSSYTTACVNFLTWNKADSIFPLQTSINHQFYPLRSLDDDFGSKLNELASQGWTTRNIVWPDFEGAKTHRLAGLRRIGSSSSLVIPLDTNSVHAPATPDFVIEYAQFEVSGKDLQFAVRYAYTTAATRWRDYVQARLKRWAWLELFKLEPENRPFQSPSALPLISSISIPQGFEMPQSWDYADDQIPEWYQEWEQTWVGKGGLR
ncbi:uncharacterized protein NECHADRAFT_88423 [Fusarium vanettenii 77-13-4]|uniref:Uncharacterized protein n=1 Tax=Fusarium vanettenii (strain ATCC MYA-4622 / CBS 123669 / FGSC 9596 / NRRL 45880 / 77-13-4) TaxID=660122 RepID=C7ZMD7_FUSV7|nr:uncharacterized protein NECHADRAFT_88423 [Fusarium vanettenii 77-13-4]EEU34813.1 hypothetical protein NECHADRAFT_88423 [Fusarium vanettenii 77-13-4]